MMCVMNMRSCCCLDNHKAPASHELNPSVPENGTVLGSHQLPACLLCFVKMVVVLVLVLNIVDGGGLVDWWWCLVLLLLPWLVMIDWTLFFF